MEPILKIGEHYRVETSTYTIDGAQLVEMDDKFLKFKPNALRKNAQRLGQILYHDQTVGIFPPELIMSNAQIVRAELWDIGA